MPNQEPRRRTSSGVAHTTHHPRGHGLRRTSSHVNAGGVRHHTTGLQALKSTKPGAPDLERQPSNRSDDSAIIKSNNPSTHLVRKKSTAHGDDKARAFRSARSDTHLPRLGGLTAMSTTRPSAKQHNSDSKRLDSVKATEDDAWDSEGSDEDDEQQVAAQDKPQKVAQVIRPAAASESDDTTDDDDDDEEEHLVIKTKGSKVPLNKRPSVNAGAASPAVERVTTRSEQPTDSITARNNLQPARQGNNRSRSRSRTRAPNNATSSEAGKARRKSSARRQSHADQHAKSGVFARTKSQIGFDVHGNDDDDMQDPSDISTGRQHNIVDRAPVKESHHDSRRDPNMHSRASQQDSRPAHPLSTIKSPEEMITSPRSVLNLEDDENKPGFPFPASDGEGPASRQKSPRADPQPARRDRDSPVIKESNNTSLRPGVGAASPNGSDSNTLVGSTASPVRASTPRLTATTALPAITQSPQIPNGPNTPPPNPPARKHVRTRNSHTSLRSLASMRLGGPPPHPLTSPGGAKGRVTSLSGRPGAAMAAPQLNREVARGLCSTSPTETTASQTETIGRNGTAPSGMPSVARTSSQRSLRDYFGLVASSKSGSRDGERQPEIIRKGSFHSTSVAGLPRVNSSSALSNAGTIANQGASSRLSAHSVAQAAARLPSTSTLSASAYGDQLPESSQVGLISRFLTPSSWNPRVLVTPTSKDRHGKSRPNTAPGSAERPSVFPQSPFAAAHASLVRTLMEDGSKPVATVNHHAPNRGADRMRSETGPAPFSSLALTPAHHDDSSRGKGGSRDSRQSKEKEMVLGLTPFEMSVSRCLEQRKNAVQLSTGRPLGPLPP